MATCIFLADIGSWNRIFLLTGNSYIRHIWVRIFSVYGPRDGKNTMVMSAINKLLNGEKPSFTKGEQQWDYLYSEDAARALYLMAVKGKDKAVYCLGSGKVRTLADYICIIRDNIDSRLEVGIGDIPYNLLQVMYLCADISSLTQDTGFVPEIEFEEGIRKTIDWCKERIAENEDN